MKRCTRSSESESDLDNLHRLQCLIGDFDAQILDLHQLALHLQRLRLRLRLRDQHTQGEKECTHRFDFACEPGVEWDSHSKHDTDTSESRGAELEIQQCDRRGGRECAASEQSIS